ncbi:MAG TPA: DUF952 domain-containing protein [Vicinamibacterales bacterium]
MILHITTDRAWLEARSQGAYTADSLATEGFIHCSTPAQVIWVANIRFRGRTDLVLLHIDPTRLDARIVYENLEGGEQLFPHVYGAIPIAAVVKVTPFQPSQDGSFTNE